MKQREALRMAERQGKLREIEMVEIEDGFGTRLIIEKERLEFEEKFYQQMREALEKNGGADAGEGSKYRWRIIREFTMKELDF